MTIQGVLVVRDEDQDSTDLMKCVVALEEKERAEDLPVRPCHHADNLVLIPDVQQYHIVLLGGLSGRLDQTIHTLSYLHKLRKTRERVFAVTDENVGWVLDAVSLFTTSRLQHPLIAFRLGRT